MMQLNTHTTSEINKKATHILFQNMGVVDTFKFLGQFSLGEGDYTKEREKWLGGQSLEEITSAIKALRKK